MPEETVLPSITNTSDTPELGPPTDNNSSPSPSGAELSPYNFTEPENKRPELSPDPFDKRPLIIGGLIAVGFMVVAVLIAYWLYNNPTKAEVIRDIFIIYLGIGIFFLIPLLIVLVIVLIYLVLKLNDLTQLLKREIAPMLITVQNSLDTVQGTLNTAKGTTTFISENAAKPVISTVSAVSAAGAIFRALFKRN